MTEKTTFTFSRRSFVKSLGIGALAFSPLVTASRALAETKVPPRLLLVMLSHGPGGPGMATGTETNFKLSNWLSPLDPIKKHLTLLDGLQGTWWGNAHDVSYSHLLTGSVKPETPSFTRPRSASLDVILENKLGRGILPVQRLQVDAWNGSGRLNKTICYDTRLQPLQFQSAVDANQALLANISGIKAPDPKLVDMVKRRKKILDEVTNDIKALRSRISPNERLKLDKHLASISSASSLLGLNGQAATTLGCAKPTPFTSGDWKSIIGLHLKGQYPANMRYEKILDQQLENVKSLFSCNLSQIAVMDIAEIPDDAYEWKDTAGKTHRGKPCTDKGFHHCVAHHATPDQRLCYEGSIQWFMKKFTAFAQDLDKIKEPNGKTLLENTIIVITGEVGTGTHNVAQKPHILIGGSGAPGLRTGRYLDIPHTNAIIKTPEGDIRLSKDDQNKASTRTESDLWRELAIVMGHTGLKTFGSTYLNRGSIALK